MKTHRIVFFLLCCSAFTMQAQHNCEKNLEKAKKIIESTSPFSNKVTAFQLTEPCALEGNAIAENYLGMLYLNGVGTEKDEAKAFAYIQRAANKDLAKAQFNLGRLYKYGIGCEIDFIEAVTWFTKASENGNQRAAYSLGYMYYKGFGVVQDYTKAKHWFEHSEDAMAKHFLGICYYAGHGVPVNKDKALELLTNNSIPNSKLLASKIQAELKDGSTTSTQTTLTNETTTFLSTANTESNTEDLEVPEMEELTKEWNAHLIQYDWSGTAVEKVISLNLNITEKSNELEVTYGIENKQKTRALWQDETLYFENLEILIDELYAIAPKKYSLLSTSLKKQKVLGNIYLSGTLDSYKDSVKEYGKPMSIVLSSKNLADSIDTDALLALASQEEQFIKLYPVPFKEELLIQYNLEEASTVKVELTSFDGNISISIENSNMKNAGTHTNNFQPNIPVGLYIIKVYVNNKVYTRMITKEN